MTYTLAGMTTLGTPTKESVPKDAQLYQQPRPFTDSDSTIVLDYFGVSKIVNYSGRYIPTLTNEYGVSGGTFSAFTDIQKLQANTRGFLWELHHLTPGTQTRRLYSSEVQPTGASAAISATAQGTIYVMIINTKWDYVAGMPGAVDFDIQMQESSGLGQ